MRVLVGCAVIFSFFSISSLLVPFLQAITKSASALKSTIPEILWQAPLLVKATVVRELGVVLAAGQVPL